MSPQTQGIGTRVSAASPPSSGRHREVIVAGHRAPASATSRRTRHLRKLLSTRKYVWGMTLVGGAVFLLGASTGKVVYAVVPLLIVIACAIGVAWREATRLAQRDFFAGFALDHQFDFSQRMDLAATTPLLSAGDRRHCENYMEGELPGVESVAVGLAHYVFETKSEHARRKNRAVPVYSPHDYTIAVVDLPRAAKTFPGLFLARRTSNFGRDGHLDRDSMHDSTIDNPDLATRAELFVRGEQDRSRLKALFTPTFQTWLLDQPRQLGFEFENGTLVVYVPKRAKDAGTMLWLLDSTSWIAKCFLRVGEPLAEVKSTPPPTGVAAFPPPPAATKPRVGPRLAPVPEPVAAPTYARLSVPPPSAD